MKNVKKLTILLLLVLMLFASCTSTKGQSTPNTTIEEVTYPSLQAHIAATNKYGNCTLDITPDQLAKGEIEVGDMLSVTIGDYHFTAPACTNYSDVNNGNPLLRINKDKNTLELAINMGNLQKASGATAGTPVTLQITGKGEYKDEYEIRHLEKSEERSDYATDAEFANFRQVTSGKIGKHILYRSCNPILDDDRAPYAEKLMQEAGVKTVINLADDAETLQSDLSDAPYYQALVKKGNVIALDMGVDFKEEKNLAKLAKGFDFMAEHEGPYLIHCNEGKDRAGYTAALLEALMGANMKEITEDYMKSFENYFGVKKGTTKYEAIKKTIESYADDFEHIDAFMQNTLGLTKAQIAAIKKNLK